MKAILPRTTTFGELLNGDAFVIKTGSPELADVPFVKFDSRRAVSFRDWMWMRPAADARIERILDSN